MLSKTFFFANLTHREECIMLDTDQFRCAPLRRSLDWRSNTSVLLQVAIVWPEQVYGTQWARAAAEQQHPLPFQSRWRWSKARCVIPPGCPYPGLLGKGSFISQRVPIPTKSPKVVSLSQAAPCRHSIPQHFQPSVPCSGSELLGAQPSPGQQPVNPPSWVTTLGQTQICALAVRDCNLSSALLILLLGTYLVPYSYPSHWWHLCTRSPTLHISLPCHPRSSCPPTLWR